MAAMLLHGHAYAFLLSRGLLLGAEADPEQATHYSYSGWKARIPPELEGGFLERVAEDIASGALNFIIEKKTSVFKMHLDLDWLEPSEVPTARIRQLVGVLGEAFAHFFPQPRTDPLFDTVIMTTTPQTGKKGTDDTTPCVKSGFHLIYPNLLVEKRQALLLRAYALSMIVERFGPRDPPCNTWDDVVDETVLRKNGLRQIGSYKRSKCPTCKGRGRRLCEMCRETGGMVIPNRRYMPVEILRGDGEVEVNKTNRLSGELQQRNYAYAVQVCGIRSHDEPTPGFNVPDDAVFVAEDDDEARHRQMRSGKRNRRYRSILSREDERRSKIAQRNKKATVDRNTTLFGLFAAEVQRYSARYANIYLDKVSYDADAKDEGRALTYVLSVKGRGQHYCAHIGKCHSSNRVYFVLTEKGLQQRCHKCRAYRGRVASLSIELTDRLFSAETVQERRREVERELRTAPRAERRKVLRDKLSTLLYEETTERIQDLRPKYEGKAGMRLADLSSNGAHAILGVNTQRVARMSMGEMLALERTCYAERSSRSPPRKKKKKKRTAREQRQSTGNRRAR